MGDEPGGAWPAVQAPADPLADEDLQLALYVAYELHYRGYAGVDELWEWDPGLLAWRAELEASFEAALLERVGRPRAAAPDDMDLQLRAVLDADGPSLSRFVEAQATLAQVRELVVHRSAYQLKEADPHSWGIPRLTGRPKAALVEIQADEYGGGSLERMHARMFASTMEALGVDPIYGAYVDRLPGVTLATVNVMSLFGLHRRWRGALVGHLAGLEMESSVPNRRYASGLRRLGLDGPATAFFDEHVVADSVHENIAAVDLAGGLVDQEPALCGDVLFGTRCLVALDATFARRLLDAWERGETLLRVPARDPAPVEA